MKSTTISDAVNELRAKTIGLTPDRVHAVMVTTICLVTLVSEGLRDGSTLEEALSELVRRVIDDIEQGRLTIERRMIS